MTQQQRIDEGYEDGKKSFEHLSREIFDSIDFKRIYKAMVAVEWYWYLGVDDEGNENYGIPSMATIKTHARRVLKLAYETGNRHSGGGFSAGWDGQDLYLTFTLDESSAS